MNNLLQKVRGFITTISYTRTLAFLSVVVILAAIPLTVYLSQLEQDIRQSAASVCENSCTSSQAACSSQCESSKSQRDSACNSNYNSCINSCTPFRDSACVEACDGNQTCINDNCPLQPVTSCINLCASVRDGCISQSDNADLSCRATCASSLRQCVDECPADPTATSAPQPTQPHVDPPPGETTRCEGNLTIEGSGTEKSLKATWNLSQSNPPDHCNIYLRIPDGSSRNMLGPQSDMLCRSIVGDASMTLDPSVTRTLPAGPYTLIVSNGSSCDNVIKNTVQLSHDSTPPPGASATPRAATPTIGPFPTSPRGGEPPPGQPTSPPGPGGPGGSAQAPACDPNQVTMTLSTQNPEPGQTVTMTLGGSQGSTFTDDDVFDTSNTRVATCSYSTGFRPGNCTFANAGTYTWIHKWRNCAPNNCEIKSDQCTKQIPISVSAPAPTDTPSAAITGSKDNANANEQVTYTANITSVSGVASSNIWVTKDISGAPTRITTEDIDGFDASKFNCEAPGTQCAWYKIGSGASLSYSANVKLKRAGTYKVMIDVTPTGGNANNRLCAGNPYVTYPISAGGNTYNSCGTASSKTLVIGGGATDTPTPTLVPGTYVDVVFELTLSGIEAGRTIVTPRRNLIVEVFTASGEMLGAVRTFANALNHNSDTGKFTATVPIQGITPGNYSFKVKTDRYLKKRLEGFINIPSAADKIIAPPTALIAGDANNDNAIDIKDFNVIVGCFAEKANTSSCTSKVNADLSDDGAVDEFDFTRYVRALGEQQGD